MANEIDRMLVCGSVDGKYESLLARLEQISAKFSGKDKFEQLFVCGEFFGSNADENKKIISGEYIVPIPVYVIGPINAERSKYYTAVAGEEIGPNIIYLGRRGVFTTASKLKIAYLSGQEGEYPDDSHFSVDTVDVSRLYNILYIKRWFKISHSFTKELIAQITGGHMESFQGVDILLTSQWPADVDKHTAHTPDVANDDQLQVSALISKLAAALKPRYHFAAMANCHYERPAYRNYKILQESSTQFPATRFVGLARCGNPSRCKWIYAFNIAPCKIEPPPQNCTEFPYTEILNNLEAKKKLMQQLSVIEERPGADQFFFDRTATGAEDNTSDKKHRKRKWESTNNNNNGDGQSAAPKRPCWFCLASPQVEKHLVVSIGEHAYLALAKGQLVPNHVLITPINHVQSLIVCQTESVDVAEEICKYQTSLRKFYAAADMCAVFFERNFRTQHFQLQCVPLPKKVVNQLRPIVEEKLNDLELEFTILSEDSQLKDVVQPGVPYFYIESEDFRLYATKLTRNFPLNFAREVLIDERLLDLGLTYSDWRNCLESMSRETDLAQEFRANFSKYDFTIDEID
uniref:CWF19-like protein 1 n=1 Tax=Romanomermis culicivorax TaxID=13658 RepID=A0A915L199_ROMCU